jgi:hypothetical protein
MQVITERRPLLDSVPFPTIRILHGNIVMLATVTAKKVQNICQRQVGTIVLIYVHQAAKVRAR